MRNLLITTLFLLSFSTPTKAEIIRLFNPTIYGNFEFRMHDLGHENGIELKDNAIGQAEFYYRFFKDEPFGVSAHLLAGNWGGHKFLEAYAGPLAKFGALSFGLSIGASNDERQEDAHTRLAAWISIVSETQQFKFHGVVSANQEAFNEDDHTYTWYDFQLQLWALDWLGVEARIMRDPGASLNVHLKWHMASIFAGFTFYNPHYAKPFHKGGAFFGFRIDY